jgi:hypothetical protein
VLEWVTLIYKTNTLFDYKGEMIMNKSTIDSIKNIKVINEHIFELINESRNIVNSIMLICKR